MRARCRVAFLLLFLPFLCVSTGCRTKTGPLEDELRTRDKMYKDAMRDQQIAEARIDALQHEVEALRKGAPITPEQAASTFGVRKIVLGRGTGGRDNDNIAGDELLDVIVEPRDESDHSIKAPGAIQIYALEVSPQGIKTPLCMWDIPPEQVHKSWKQGLLSTGYMFSLPWKVLPTTETVRIIVRFTTPDQRVFEADRDIKVKLVAGAVQKRINATTPLPPPCPPQESEGPVLVPTNRITTQWRPADGGQGVSLGEPLRGGD